MVESIAAGTGVIALRGGGANEIIRDGQTGVFFDSPNEESLNRAIVRYEATILKARTFNNGYVFNKFDSNQFRSAIKKVVDEG